MNGPHEQGVRPDVPPDFPRPGPPSSDDTTMAMLCHLLAIFTGFIGPLVIWLVQRDKSRFVDAHGREVLNFVFTMTIVFIVLTLLLVCGGVLAPATGGASMVLFCVFYAVLLGLGIYELVALIMGCVEAARGGFRPYSIRIEFLAPINPYGP
jgi:uncharacterized Tic20 family protein